MPHAQVTRRPSSLARILMSALVLSLLPLATAFAEPNPYVRVTRDGTDVRLTQRARSTLMMTAQQGAVLEVMHIDGDRYAHRNSNWYWVLLPPDPWGVRRVGWIRGDLVEHVPPPATASAAETNLAAVP